MQARRGVTEYVQALRSRYFGATKEEKGKMLDEFTEVTGLHRKVAIPEGGGTERAFHHQAGEFAEEFNTHQDLC